MRFVRWLVLAVGGVMLMTAGGGVAADKSAQAGRSRSAASEAKKEQRPINRAILERYFRTNGIPVNTILEVGMRVDELRKVLGPATGRYWVWQGRYYPDNGRGGREKLPPDAEVEEWLVWYHNPQNFHVAPKIRVRVENGVVRFIHAGNA